MTDKITMARLEEMVGAGVPCVRMRPDEEARLVQELRSYRTASNPLQSMVDRFPGGEAAFNAVLQCPHEVDAEKVILKADHSKPGNALAQLHARLSAIETTPAPVSEITEEMKAALTDYLWMEFCELPDRSSPEDYPDMALVSQCELTAIVETFFERAALTAAMGGE